MSLVVDMTCRCYEGTATQVIGDGIALLYREVDMPYWLEEAQREMKEAAR
jgi:hypothetical protein